MVSQRPLDEEPRALRSLAARRGKPYDKGRGFVTQALWTLLSNAFVARLWCPNRLRCAILRAFGATIGQGVWVRHHVQIRWPWHLTIGDNSWIGVGAEIIALEPVIIESDVCISQYAMLCTGSHDYRAPDFVNDNGPIVLRRGVWVCTRATILRGVTVGANTVIGATALVTRDVEPGVLVLAPAPVIRPQRRV